MPETSLRLDPIAYHADGFPHVLDEYNRQRRFYEVLYLRVGKLVKPGDRVDLIGVLDTGNGKEGKVSRVILQDVVVLAVGKSVTNNAPRTVEYDNFAGKERVKSLAEDFSFSSVTLEVEPAQAQMLALILANGENSLSLSLRVGLALSGASDTSFSLGSG